MQNDVFLCHASEDKSEFVRPLAEVLRARGVNVWYDEFSLKPGDSLRKSIDLGLSKSKFGIVVLSEAFFAKDWTEWELNGLVQRHLASESGIIIPIWHKVDARRVVEFSPPIADIVAINSRVGVDAVAEQLHYLISPLAAPSPVLATPTEGSASSSSGQEVMIMAILEALRRVTSLIESLANSRIRTALFTRDGDTFSLLEAPRPRRSRNMFYRAGETLMGHVFATGSSLVVPDVDAFSDVHASFILDSNDRISSICAIPMRDVSNGTFAVLCIDSSKANAFTGRILELCTFSAELLSPLVRAAISRTSSIDDEGV